MASNDFVLIKRDIGYSGVFYEINYIDGISTYGFDPGYRILIKNQLNKNDNGIYYSKSFGDFIKLDIEEGSIVFVEEGLNADSSWILSDKIWYKFSSIFELEKQKKLEKGYRFIDEV